MNEGKVDLIEENSAINKVSEDIFALFNPFENARKKLGEKSEMFVEMLNAFSKNAKCYHSFLDI